MADHHGPEWRKSSFSTAGGNCVEVARLAGRKIGVRDGKRPDAAPLVFGASAFAAFLAGVGAGGFDRAG